MSHKLESTKGIPLILYLVYILICREKLILIRMSQIGPLPNMKVKSDLIDIFINDETET
jgi:hypothetical protein